jgi:hypothetical protein
MASRYNKVMVVEVGGIDEQIENTSNADCYDKSGENVPKGWVLFLGTTRGVTIRKRKK